MWRDFSSDIDTLVISRTVSTCFAVLVFDQQTTGEVVPSLQLAAVVHAYGRLKIIDDPEWLGGLVSRLTERFEGARSDPWKVTDAPKCVREQQLHGIVGVEIDQQIAR